MKLFIVAIILLLSISFNNLAQTPPGTSIVLDGSSQFLDFTTPSGSKALREISGRFTSARIGHGTYQVVFDRANVGLL